MDNGSLNLQQPQHSTIASNSPTNALNDTYEEPQQWQGVHQNFQPEGSTIQETSQRSTIDLDGHSRDISNQTLGQYEEHDVTNQESEPHENPRSRPIWSGIVDWVKGQDLELPSRSCNSRPLTTNYTQVAEDGSPVQEKTSTFENTKHPLQPNDDEGTTLSRAYTKTAAAAVHTFLGHSHDTTTYSAGV